MFFKVMIMSVAKLQHHKVRPNGLDYVVDAHGGGHVTVVEIIYSLAIFINKIYLKGSTVELIYLTLSCFG